MKLRFLMCIITSWGIMFSAQAQYAADALRFSQTQSGSNARFKAIGNAQTAIGGDLSSLGANPAGLGLFTRSDVGFTLEFNNYNSSADFLNRNTISGKDVLNLNQAGAVFHFPALRTKGSDLENGWISFDFGLGYNRNADYGLNTVYSGINPTNSIADYFAELASNNYGDPSTLAGTGSLEEMAYNNYLIDDVNNAYVGAADINSEQTKSEERKGGQTQINMALAANYSNRFYIGFNLGFVNLNYRSDSQFTENGYNTSQTSNYESSYLQNQETKGKGFNAKLGFIFKPIPAIRLGATYESPSWLEMDDSYTEVLNTNYTKTELNYTNDAQNYSFTYRLRTPMKLSGGIGIFLGGSGFISADVDAVDYSNIQFRGMNNSDLTTISNNNEAVASLYKKTVNYRLGAEFKLDNLMIRGGYGIQGNPYRDLDDTKFKTTTYSAGLGYRIKNYYLDLSYQSVTFNSDLKPYSLNNGTEPIALIKNTRNNIFMTLGCRF